VTDDNVPPPRQRTRPNHATPLPRTRPTQSAKRVRHVRAAAGLLVVAALALVGACTPNAVSSVPAVGDRATATRAASQICARFATLAFGEDTRTDTGPADARRRAARHYGTPELATQLDGQGADATWPLLVAHHAHITVTTTIENDDPTVTATQATATVVAHAIAEGADGWQQPLPDTVVYCTAARTGTTWTITSVALADDNSPVAATGAP
jgi:hypothetical protein